MTPAPVPSAVGIDVGVLIDTGPWPAFARLVLVLTATTVMLDGFDGQLIGFAIPVMMRDWHLARTAFAPTVVGGLAGMGLGSAVAGWLADRVGRRPALVASTLVFGIATCAVALSPDPAVLVATRFVAGLGIGGALPTATTLAAEFTPRRHRTLAVTLTIVCVPLGGLLAGLFASLVLPPLGWRALFAGGGCLPLGLCLLLVRALPESPRFLAHRPARRDELMRLLARAERPMPSNAILVDRRETVVATRTGLRAIFEPLLVRDTLALGAAFFLCLFAVYSAFSWLPTMLTAAGLSVGVAGAGLTAYNLGGVVGALACAAAIARYGSFRPLIACAAGGAATAFGLGAVDLGNVTVATPLLALHGFFVNAVQSTMFAVCAYVYPTNVRATGTAAALVFGRLGAIAAGAVGAAIITAGGPPRYLAMLGAAMLGVLVTLTLVRHHIPVPSGAPARHS